jgi:hypothetical protein
MPDVPEIKKLQRGTARNGSARSVLRRDLISRLLETGQQSALSLSLSFSLPLSRDMQKSYASQVGLHLPPTT